MSRQLRGLSRYQKGGRRRARDSRSAAGCVFARGGVWRTGRRGKRVLRRAGSRDAQPCTTITADLTSLPSKAWLFRFQSGRLSTARHGAFPIAPIDWTKGKRVMTDWKTDLDALVGETMAFARTIRREQPPATDLVERPRLQPMNWGGPQREEVRQRVANFKAHQQRLIREREDYAASTLRRMLDTKH